MQTTRESGAISADALKAQATLYRKTLLEVLNKAGSGHPGGSLSSIDVLTVLYHVVLKFDPDHPEWQDRDRFILSKGHACPALYVVLTNQGFFEPTELWGLRKLDSLLMQGSADVKVPGVEMPGGSLGQGLSGGVGMALAARHRRKQFRVFVLMGDGEIQEGQVWEAAMSAGHFGLDNLVAIVDYNKIQGDGLVSSTMTLEPLADKWRAFGWEVLSVDGHDHAALVQAFRSIPLRRCRPHVILANTVKGKGVSFMEGEPKWHGSGVPNAEQLDAAIRELDAQLSELTR